MICVTSGGAGRPSSTATDASSAKVECRFVRERWSSGAGLLVPQEEPVTVTINGRELVTMLATPGDRLALVAGFLFDEGIIDRIEQIESLEEETAGVRVRAEGVDLGLRLFQRRVLGSGCGRSFTFTSALDALAAAGRALPVDLPWVGASVVLQSAQATYYRGRALPTHPGDPCRRAL